MNALVKKEIRLLLPVWVTALLLLIAPIPLGSLFEYYDSATNAYASGTARLTMFSLAVGCILLGLAGFGREMSSQTFSLLLSQPRPREEYWRAKIGVLLGLLIALALFLGLVSWQFVPPAERRETALVWLLTASVAVTGGLWTTLLFRQIIASFWISVLLPFAILVCVLSLENEVVGCHGSERKRCGKRRIRFGRC
jgi:ABC-type transport system involved in multi-copper enzyme maturation permease subunit